MRDAQGRVVRAPAFEKVAAEFAHIGEAGVMLSHYRLCYIVVFATMCSSWAGLGYEAAAPDAALLPWVLPVRRLWICELLPKHPSIEE